jgi:hypothetical protein
MDKNARIEKARYKTRIVYNSFFKCAILENRICKKATLVIVIIEITFFKTTKDKFTIVGYGSKSAISKFTINENFV